MKKIFKEAMRRYQNWRYRRLYRKLFWFYAKIKIDGDAAGQNAAEAFKWLTRSTRIASVPTDTLPIIEAGLKSPFVSTVLFDSLDTSSSKKIRMSAFNRKAIFSKSAA